MRFATLRRRSATWSMINGKLGTAGACTGAGRAFFLGSRLDEVRRGPRVRSGWPSAPRTLRFHLLPEIIWRPSLRPSHRLRRRSALQDLAPEIVLVPQAQVDRRHRRRWLWALSRACLCFGLRGHPRRPHREDVVRIAHTVLRRRQLVGSLPRPIFRWLASQLQKRTERGTVPTSAQASRGRSRRRRQPGGTSAGTERSRRRAFCACAASPSSSPPLPCTSLWSSKEEVT